MGSDSYALAEERYPLPAWAQHFVVRMDHSLARWNRLSGKGTRMVLIGLPLRGSMTVKELAPYVG